MTSIPQPSLFDGKSCSKCKKWLPFSCFYKDRRKTLGLRSSCIECCRQDGKIPLEKRRIYEARYNSKHPDRRTSEKAKARNRTYMAIRRAKYPQYQNKYANASQKKRLKTNPVFRETVRQRWIINNLRRKGTGEKLPYTRHQLKSHIETLWTEGMSWENYGKWHIDHIRPVSLFVAEGVTDCAIISALSNLQPLWAEENIAKSNKYE